MGNSITSCCQSQWTSKATFKGSHLRPNGNHMLSATKHNVGKKKKVRFVEQNQLTNSFESSAFWAKPNFQAGWEAVASTSKLSYAESKCSDQANTVSSESNLSSIEDVTDIHSVYIFDKMIGDGKFGTVYLAHPRSDPLMNVAIKMIKREDFSHRIEKELHLLKSISHESIITFMGAYKDNKYFYIVTDYVEGGELFHLLQKETWFDELEACELMYKILVVVKYLHDCHICHRDLKPENILLWTKDNERHIKLIDFGLSTYVSPTKRLKKKLGTPYYLAPEILEEDYNIEIDMWSIGVISYVLLCGYPPFQGEGPRELFRSIYNVDYSFPDEDWSFISDEAKDFISRLLVKNQKERLTVDEALSHPWIMSWRYDDEKTSTETYPDELHSSMSEAWKSIDKKIEAVKKSSFSKSQEWTTLDSYEKGIDGDHLRKDSLHVF